MTAWLVANSPSFLTRGYRPTRIHVVADDLMVTHKGRVKAVSEIKDNVSLFFHSTNGRFGKSSG